MAKAKVRGINEAIDEVFKDYKSALRKAMEDASKIAKDDIEFKAKSCLYEYYENFQPGTGEPNWYERTDNLVSSFVPYASIGFHKNLPVIRASVGMGYWPSKLDGIYSGSNRWTPVDGEWVLENYLKGIHPTTDGSSYIGAPYLPVFDSISPEEKMEKYLQDYVETFRNNVLLSFVKQITRR